MYWWRPGNYNDRGEYTSLIKGFVTRTNGKKDEEQCSLSPTGRELPAKN